jgi:hypothetical protein
MLRAEGKRLKEVADEIDSLRAQVDDLRRQYEADGRCAGSDIPV